MKKFLSAFISACALALSAADPGGYPGFVKAVFTSSFNMTSDIWANAQSRVFVPDEIYATSLATHTTVAFGSYMRMEAGITYQFKGCYDDYVAVKIGDAWVVSKGGECVERTGSFTPSESDWYKIELRVGNNGLYGGLQNSSQYGILWKTSTETEWRRFGTRLSQFKTGLVSDSLEAVSGVSPEVVSARMRENDPTVMDVVYTVWSDKPTVDVRALAFEDGERSFWKVVRPETFVKDADGHETAQNVGDGIAANVEHTLSWKVSSDWKTDLAKVKFEILTREDGVLPLDLITIPSVNGNPEITCSYNAQTDADVLNAMYWYYADGADDLVLDDGYLKTPGGEELVNRATLGNKFVCVQYLVEKMGWTGMSGPLLDFARTATRKTLNFNSSVQNALVKQHDVSGELYAGDRAYCVVDVSGGTNVVTYPVTYLDQVPLAGWGDAYKTTKILLRRIEPGSFVMDVNWNTKKSVTLTKPFYMGVFEVTQKQWELVMGNTPADRKGGTRPVEQVSWYDVRGTRNWPTVRTVAATSFMGRLQAKTGLAFDLPTDAQWEYACRAGTTSDYNNGGGTDADLKVLGRYDGNRSYGKGGYTDAHTTVGSYLPNAWGLYDMHGNVWEWCLDWCADLNSDPASDPEGASSGSFRVLRGGSWCGDGSSARSSNRLGCIYPSYRIDSCGFRLSMTLTDK